MERSLQYHIKAKKWLNFVWVSLFNRKPSETEETSRQLNGPFQQDEGFYRGGKYMNAPPSGGDGESDHVDENWN